MTKPFINPSMRNGLIMGILLMDLGIMLFGFLGWYSLLINLMLALPLIHPGFK